MNKNPGIKLLLHIPVHLQMTMLTNNKRIQIQLHVYLLCTDWVWEKHHIFHVRNASRLAEHRYSSMIFTSGYDLSTDLCVQERSTNMARHYTSALRSRGVKYQPNVVTSWYRVTNGGNGEMIDRWSRKCYSRQTLHWSRCQKAISEF